MMQPDADAVDAVRVRREMGHYLAGYRWDHFVTLTTEREISVRSIVTAFKHEFVRSLARKAQRALSYFFVVEGGDHLGGWHHVHALLYGTGALVSRSVAQSWWRGYTNVKRYDPSQGAAWYVSKGLQADADNYDFSRRKPPRLTQSTHAVRSDREVIELLYDDAASAR